MLILGIFLCVIALFVLYKRLSLIFFGRETQGYIVGYGEAVRGTNGFETYSYKIRYEYSGREYFAYSLESASVPRGSIPDKNINRRVTVFFRPDKPEVVTVKEFKGSTIIGFIFLLLGILSVIAQFIL